MSLKLQKCYKNRSFIVQLPFIHPNSSRGGGEDSSDFGEAVCISELEIQTIISDQEWFHFLYFFLNGKNISTPFIPCLKRKCPRSI